MKNLVDSRIRNIYLKPGELYVSRLPALVSTVLGSCVSVVLHVPDQSIGGMCHAMLPKGARDHEFRYVDSAITHMYERIRSLCGSDVRIEAKLFGGADVLNPGERHTGAPSVGSQNIQAAQETLKTLGLGIAVSDTGGDRGRKLFFYSDTGVVFLRLVRRTVR